MGRPYRSPMWYMQMLVLVLFVVLLLKKITEKPAVIPNPKGHAEEFRLPNPVRVVEAQAVPPRQELDAYAKMKQDRLTPEDAVLRRRAIASLKAGVHYFADYDLSKVHVDPMPPPTDPNGQPYFHYMSPNHTKWEFVYVSNRPRIALVPEFLSDEECDEYIKEATTKIARSQVAPEKGSHASNVQNVRTSSGAWLDNSIEGSVSNRVMKRVLDLLGGGMPNHFTAEQQQVLRYYPGQLYEAHEDYFHPSRYGPQTSNRAVTVYLYLSDVEEGGETAFPRADGKGMPPNYKDCNWGFRTRPLKRAAAIFYNMSPNAEFDPLSLHESCPVVKGIKWGAPLWIRIPTGGKDWPGEPSYTL